MAITNLFPTFVDFFRLTVSRYLGINLMGEKIENIFNYLWLNNKIATGGQPTEKQLVLIKDAGYEIVINLALTTSENALPDEKAVVESLGMQYIHIPINFNHPTQEDFALFCEAMQTYQDKKFFIHCAANLRVSAFLYLYRTLYQNVNEKSARQDLNKLWQPNKTWQNLIDEITNNHSLITQK
ncbi:conserved hypothetical protein [Hyella patelloides LEGE 07179]|uniref:DSP-PTPase phosphatase fused to NAD+ Kinase domain-containing protein n=1 Tax=Hyella patelloides LEGE 07179 TaxID=945734 RepID=A0A563VSJ7_9CYAN|nr:protein tyrosine phosphatase family protein [Hyella patelloides]VEP14405.1 conserved hypothetical protein [Hyella patelloides LEGE 07179]